jgi:hypothetical protein
VQVQYRETKTGFDSYHLPSNHRSTYCHYRIRTGQYQHHPRGNTISRVRQVQATLGARRSKSLVKRRTFPLAWARTVVRTSRALRVPLGQLGHVPRRMCSVDWKTTQIASMYPFEIQLTQHERLRSPPEHAGELKWDSCRPWLAKYSRSHRAWKA